MKVTLPTFLIKRASLFAGILFLTVLTGCFGPKKSSVSKLSETEKLDFAFNFFEASKNKMIGNTDKALNHYLQCVRIDQSSDPAMYEIALLLQGKNKYDNALEFIRGASAIRPDNIWYALSLAELLQKNNLHSEAVKVFEKLIQKFPTRLDFYFDLAEAQLYDDRFADAIKTYDKIDSMIGLSMEVSVQKEKIYLKLGKFDKAVLEIQKLIDSNPQESKYYALLVDLYQANNMPEKAMEALKSMELLDPNNPYLHLSKADYYYSIGEKAKSFSELKLAFENTSLELETKIGILTSYYARIQKSPELKEQALVLNKLLVEAHPGDARAFAIFGDFLYQSKLIGEARVQYRKAVALDPQSYMVWQYLLLSSADLRDYESLESESNEALTLFPTQPFLYYFNGFSKVQNSKEREAISTLNAGLKLVVENDPLLLDFYSSLGDAYNKLKEYQKSDSAFENALKIDPKNSLVLNNYSYYLSLRSERLKEAAKMSLLSNQLDPGNSSNLDTYAWILYQDKQFKDAQEWIEKAIENGGDKSPVILEHYGDILWKLSLPEKANEYWIKAKEAGKGSDLLEKKVLEKKLFE